MGITLPCFSCRKKLPQDKPHFFAQGHEENGFHSILIFGREEVGVGEGVCGFDRIKRHGGGDGRDDDGLVDIRDLVDASRQLELLFGNCRV